MMTNNFGNQKYMQPMGRLKHALKVPWFYFLLSLWGQGGGWGKRIVFHFSFVPNMFLLHSVQVPNMFLRFPMAPRFNPICFAQSPPLLTYIGGPKGEALHLSIESSILGILHSFNLMLWWANQIGSLQKKVKKVGLVRLPQLINMNQNKYPQFRIGGVIYVPKILPLPLA